MSCFAQVWPTFWSCWICTTSLTPFTGSKPSQTSTPQTRNPSENSRPRARWTKNYSRPWRWLWNVWRCISRWVLDSILPALLHTGTIFTFYFCLPLMRDHVTFKTTLRFALFREVMFYLDGFISVVPQPMSILSEFCGLTYCDLWLILLWKLTQLWLKYHWFSMAT